MSGNIGHLDPRGRILIPVVLVVLFFFSTTPANAAVSSDIGSVGVISSVSGNAQITHSTSTQQSDQPTFRGPIVYGDHLSTSKDATLGLLVGRNSLLTMRELSDVRIAETTRNRQILEMVSGRACLAVGQPGPTTTEPLTLRTPTAMVTAAPGTLFSVDVEEAPKKSARQSETGEEFVTLVAMSAQGDKQGKAFVVETYQVVEGSIDIVSLASPSSSAPLRAGQSLRVVGGVRGQPFVAPPVNCRAQDVQIIPSHTSIPAPAQQAIVQQQTQIAATESPTGNVAAMAPLFGSPSTVVIPSGVIIPPTGILVSDIPGPTTRTTVTVTLP